MPSASGLFCFRELTLRGYGLLAATLAQLLERVVEE
ncbi:MAG: hypothetical protein K0S37_3696 [Microbacterium sp.]|jgi:hypothetical protein|nr:hypothetical protein [Microbacterium sp.]